MTNNFREIYLKTLMETAFDIDWDEDDFNNNKSAEAHNDLEKEFDNEVMNNSKSNNEKMSKDEFNSKEPEKDMESTEAFKFVEEENEKIDAMDEKGRPAEAMYNMILDDIDAKKASQVKDVNDKAEEVELKGVTHSLYVMPDESYFDFVASFHDEMKPVINTRLEKPIYGSDIEYVYLRFLRNGLTSWQELKNRIAHEREIIRHDRALTKAMRADNEKFRKTGTRMPQEEFDKLVQAEKNSEAAE